MGVGLDVRPPALRCVPQSVFEYVPMSIETLNSFFALAIGFSLAGALVSAYQVLIRRPPGFSLLAKGPTPGAFAAVPFLAFAAPFIIMRNTVRVRRMEKTRVEAVMIATVVAGFWALMSGTVLINVLQVTGVIG